MDVQAPVDRQVDRHIAGNTGGNILKIDVVLQQAGEVFLKIGDLRLHPDAVRVVHLVDLQRIHIDLPAGIVGSARHDPQCGEREGPVFVLVGLQPGIRAHAEENAALLPRFQV